MSLQFLPVMASYNDAPVVSGSASVHSNSEESLHPSVVSDLFDGELSADELNEIPALPDMEAGMDFDSEAAHSLQIALTASVLDGALGNFELFAPTLTTSVVTAPVSSVVPQEVPILPASAYIQDIIMDDVASKQTKKRGTPQKSGGSTKKRKVIKTKAEQEFPVLGPKVGLISPSSSLSNLQPLSGLSDCKMTVTPPLSPMPVLPPVTASATKPLLPKPSTKAPTPPRSSAPSPTPSSDGPLLVLPDSPPNITTDHIQMLTSENGPSECAKAIVTVTTGVDGRRVSKSHLSQEERAQASRDRNREHARNTRLRKKAYVEELKRTLDALCAQRDVEAVEEQRRKKLETQHRSVRFSVLEEFLRLRGTNQGDAARWSAILVPEFTLRLPTINAQDQVGEKKLSGVTQVMDDSNVFSGFVQTLGSGVTLEYSMDRSNLFMDGNNAVLEWDATSVGAIANGAKDEIKFHGNMKAQFDPESNKMVSSSLLFDSAIVLAQKKSVASA